MYWSDLKELPSLRTTLFSVDWQIPLGCFSVGEQLIHRAMINAPGTVWLFQIVRKSNISCFVTQVCDVECKKEWFILKAL